MLSRVADNLYWMGRYVERAEYLARLLEDAFYLELDTSAVQGQSPRPLDAVLGMFNANDSFERWHKGLTRRGKEPKRESAASRESILRFLTFARSDGLSVRAMISFARENARGTQDALSAEVWSQLNQTYLYLTSTKALSNFKSSALRFFTRVRRECLLFAALVHEVMPRTEAYHFIQIGRYLERIDMVCRILGAHYYWMPAAGEEDHHGVEAGATLFRWRGLLRSCAAYEGYLQETETQLEPRSVLAYLLLATDSPRSVRNGTMRCLESLRYLGGAEGAGGRNDAERQLGRLESDLRYTDLDEILAQGVAPFLDHILALTSTVGNDLHQAYFRI